MTVDKKYCMSSFLMYRTIADELKCFSEDLIPNLYHQSKDLFPVRTSQALEAYLRKRVERICARQKVALALSGGIDSAILAKFMPKGSVAYTFKCVVPGIEVVDETPAAKRYAEACGLEHRVVEIYWEDFEKYAPILMRHKGMPIHSIEVQIYKAALQVKEDGFDTLLFGESSDVTYGGMNGLLSKDWLIGEFVDRYSYVLPYKALKDPELVLEPYKKVENDGRVDAHQFCRTTFLEEGLGSYSNACQCAGVELKAPYSETVLAEPLDYSRVRNGENKYLVREVFQRLYPDWNVPPKVPMPRPMNEWMANWEGPTRPEFWPHCTDHMTGDQKWMVWALERFLNMVDNNISRGGGVETIFEGSLIVLACLIHPDEGVRA